MLERWKNGLDKNGSVYALSMDLSKAFDTIKHDFLVAKPIIDGFSKDALTLWATLLKIIIYVYLKQHKRFKNITTCRL